MTTLPNNGPSSPADGRDSHGRGEDTLRLVAVLPAPDGLAERVKEGLRSAPETGRILMWRSPLRPAAGWMYGSVARGAAAAAIVCLVAGGGWRIYSHVQPASGARVVVMPSPAAPIGSAFSNAGATRRPDTVVGPVLTQPVAPAPEVNAPEVNAVEKAPAQPKGIPRRETKKSPSRPVAARVQ
jgi:hypothetical protein